MHRRRRNLSLKRVAVSSLVVLLLFLLLFASPAVGLEPPDLEPPDGGDGAPGAPGTNGDRDDRDTGTGSDVGSDFDTEFELPEPRHGVEDGFDALWSGYRYDAPSEDASAEEYLTRSSDVYFTEPPGAPDRWNSGEVSRFDGGGANASVHPADAELEDGEVVKDAYVSFFDVSDSTLAQFSDEKQVLYIPRDGEVRAFVDYRVDEATVENHSVEVKLVETGEKVSGTGGFTVPYEGVSSGDLVRRDPRDEPIPPDWTPDDETAEMTLRANVTAEWTEGDEAVEETVVVNDTLGVEPYDTSIPPAIAIYGGYPDGDAGVFFLRDEPWSSVEISDDVTVQSNWRFFSARDTDWDSARVSTAEGSTTADETYHPLQVHAYPSRSGVRVEGDGEIKQVVGDSYLPPTLADGLSFDLPSDRYTTTHGFDIRYDGDAGAGDVQMNGILPDTSDGVLPFPDVQRIRATDLTLEVVDEGEDYVEVKVSLVDEDGNPVDTRRDDGYVRIEGRENVETGIDGTETVEISPRPSGGVVAEYVPEPWYEADTPYVGDTDVVNPDNSFDLLDEMGMLSQLFVFLLPFLLAVYFLDRMLSLGIWPPWRRI